MNELQALVILAATPYIGSIRIRLLIERFGSAQATLESDPAEIAQIPGFGPKIMESWGHWRSSNQWRQTLSLAEHYGAEIVPYTSPLYPRRLKEIPDHPVLLYIKGDLQPCDQNSIAIVGTRQASIYGQEMAEKFGTDLAAMGYTVVSGLARGIDTAAHKGALKKGRTLAIIGSGLADIYPRENLALAENIAAQGALITEFPMQAPPDRQNFPQRNRIVSALTLATVLIEAPVKSGAMLTMENAQRHGRKLFALPGRVDSGSFEGNHLLIKRGQAQLVENAQEIVDSFGDLFAGSAKTIKEQSIPSLEKEEEDLLKLLPKEESSIEELLFITKLPIMKLNILLMSLMLKQVIKEFPGKVYKRIA